MSLLLLLLLLPGPCSFTTTAFRHTDLPQPAASYIIAPHGPTLCGQGQYAVPPGERPGFVGYFFMFAC
jgi:hypothetical protein